MGVARLLAKGWVLVCLFAGAHAVAIAVASGAYPISALPPVIVCTLLFVAMGLLFVGGYGVSAVHGGLSHLKQMKAAHFIPNFNDAVFLAFVVLSFIDQITFAPNHLSGDVTNALESAIYFAVPGQRALLYAIVPCALDGGRIFASAFTWLLAIIFLCSSISRLKLAAGLMRLERATHPEVLGPATLAFVLGIAAVVGIQLLFVGSVFSFLPCSAYADIPGRLIVGLAPLMLSYLIVAALTALLASGHDK
ncbi:MAG: hypothetical protein KGI68_07820 [Alphaproteobacteria bacterium]|nr:hypothetical protein [Alphaproteobacteria bacterium]MDE1986660.1 hypothetical protein [Alphaproteobacteria bacterium]MDE2164403.1 hypothetical protein [Alphaproteobacteria bacterium]MDE2266074.1 hypothetical protein [Alphaproteobacteria bacterium]MDE2500153.1 hypothetical protein [Alphaproteobacteria bacterium]